MKPRNPNIKKRGPSYDREFYVNEVVQLRVKGKSMNSLLSYLMSDKIGISKKIAYEIIGDAQKVIVEQQKIKIESAFAEAMSKLENLYENSAENKIKLEILKEINKLKGLYAADKIDMNITQYKAKFDSDGEDKGSDI